MKIAYICGILCAGSVALALPASQSAPKPQAPQSAPKAQVVQKTFDTAKQAVDALIAAAAAFDTAALESLFGSDGRDLALTEDAVQDKNRAEEFAAKAHERTFIAADPANANRVTLSVGTDGWPFPVPIVRRSGRWSFDTKAGRQEVINRRVGGNELDAIEICRGFVEAQHEYALSKRAGAAVNQYAQRIISTPGKQDGLAWQNADGSWGGPVGEGVARAIDQGYADRAEPFHGYFFKVLKGQGSAAPLGEMDFVIKGVMIGGFALVAAPAEYAVTGVMTFMVSHDGVVYEKDFGDGTLNAFKAMERFNPDKSWTPVAVR